jgi:hypothetical protein
MPGVTLAGELHSVRGPVAVDEVELFSGFKQCDHRGKA